jgi:hypothetical protein
MKKDLKNKKNRKRAYTRPSVDHIRVDNEISMVMMTPPDDPDDSINPDHFGINPFRLPKL